MGKPSLFYSSYYSDVNKDCTITTTKLCPVNDSTCVSGSLSSYSNLMQMHVPNNSYTGDTCEIAKGARKQWFNFKSCGLGLTSWPFDPVNDFIVFPVLPYNTNHEDGIVVDRIKICRYNSSHVLQATVLDVTGLNVPVDYGNGIVNVQTNGFVNQPVTDPGDYMAVTVELLNTQAHSSTNCVLQIYSGNYDALRISIPLDIPFNYHGKVSFSSTATMTANPSTSKDGKVSFNCTATFIADVTLPSLQVTTFRWETTDGEENDRTQIGLKNSNVLLYEPSDFDMPIYNCQVNDATFLDGEYLEPPTYWRARLRFVVKNNSSVTISNFKPVLKAIVLSDPENYPNWRWCCTDLGPLSSKPWAGAIDQADLNVLNWPLLGTTPDAGTSYKTTYVTALGESVFTSCHSTSPGQAIKFNTSNYRFDTGVSMGSGTILRSGGNRDSDGDQVEGWVSDTAEMHLWERLAPVSDRWWHSTNGTTWNDDTSTGLPAAIIDFSLFGLCRTNDGVLCCFASLVGASGYDIWCWQLIGGTWQNERMVLDAGSSNAWILKPGVQAGNDSVVFMVAYSPYDYVRVIQYWGTGSSVVIYTGTDKNDEMLGNSEFSNKRPIFTIDNKYYVHNGLDNSNGAFVLHSKGDEYEYRNGSWKQEWFIDKKTTVSGREIWGRCDQWRSEFHPLKFVHNGVVGEECFFQGWPTELDQPGLDWGSDDNRGQCNGKELLNDSMAYGFNPTTNRYVVLCELEKYFKTDDHRFSDVVLNQPVLDGQNTTQQLGSGTFVSPNNGFLSWGVSNDTIPDIAPGSEVEIVCEVGVRYYLMNTVLSPYLFKLKLDDFNGNFLFDTNLQPEIKAYRRVRQYGRIYPYCKATMTAKASIFLAGNGFPFRAKCYGVFNANAIVMIATKVSFSGKCTTNWHPKGSDLNLHKALIYEHVGDEVGGDPLTSTTREIHITEYSEFINPVSDNIGTTGILPKRIRWLLTNNSHSLKNIKVALEFRNVSPESPDTSWQKPSTGYDGSNTYLPVMMSPYLGEQPSDGVVVSTLPEAGSYMGYAYPAQTYQGKLYFLSYVILQSPLDTALYLYEYDPNTSVSTLHSTIMPGQTSSRADQCSLHILENGDMFVILKSVYLGADPRRVFRYNGSSWVLTPISGIPTTANMEACFTIDNNNDIWIVYSVISSTSDSLWVAKWNGTSFDTPYTDVSAISTYLYTAFYHSDIDGIRIAYRGDNGHMYETVFDTVGLAFITPVDLLQPLDLPSITYYSGDAFISPHDSSKRLAIFFDGSSFRSLLTYSTSEGWKICPSGFSYYFNYIYITQGTLTFGGDGCFFYIYNKSQNTQYDLETEWVYGYKSGYRTMSDDGIVHMLYGSSQNFKVRTNPIPYLHDNDTTQVLGTGNFVNSNKGCLAVWNEQYDPINIPVGSEVEILTMIQFETNKLFYLEHHPIYEFRLVNLNADVIESRENYPTIAPQRPIYPKGLISFSGVCTTFFSGKTENVAGEERLAEIHFTGDATMDPTASVAKNIDSSAIANIVVSGSSTGELFYPGSRANPNMKLGLQNSSFNVVKNAKISFRGTCVVKAFTGLPPQGCPLS